MNLSQILLMLFVGAIAGLIFAAQLPGAWWQWLLLALLLFMAAGVASASEENPRG